MQSKKREQILTQLIVKLEPSMLAAFRKKAEERNISISQLFREVATAHLGSTVAKPEKTIYRKAYESQYTLVCFYVPVEFIKTLSEWAKKEEVTRSYLIRSIIASFLEKGENKDGDLPRPN